MVGVVIIVLAVAHWVTESSLHTIHCKMWGKKCTHEPLSVCTLRKHHPCSKFGTHSESTRYMNIKPDPLDDVRCGVVGGATAAGATAGVGKPMPGDAAPRIWYGCGVEKAAMPKPAAGVAWRI